MYSTTEKLSTNINEVQSDILIENVTNNPLLKASTISTRNKSLDTSAKNVIRSINELLVKINKIEEYTKTSVDNQYQAIGDLTTHPEMITNLHAVSPSIIELLLDVNTRLKAIENLAKDDFEDVFTVGDAVQTEFKLTHKPLGKIYVYIDGLKYLKSNYEYNSETNTITWIFTESKGGFDIKDSEVVFEYDYIEETTTTTTGESDV